MPDKPFTYEKFREIYEQVPRLCIDLVIPEQTGVLLTLRTLDTWRNQWHFPGGTLYYEETVEQAVARIGAEELGIPVSADKLLGYIEYPSERKVRGFGWSVALAMLCVTDDSRITLNEEASAYGYFVAPPPNTVPEQMRFIQERWDEIRW